MKKYNELDYPWFGEIAKHPDCALVPFYGVRCQMASPVCPYCGEATDSDVTTNHLTFSVTCSHCYRSYESYYAAGYGYSSKPITCEEGQHNYVLTGQYVHEGKYCRAFECVTCENKVLIKPDNMTKFLRQQAAKLPLIELLDPFGELVMLPVPERATPVLDLLRSGAPLSSENVDAACSESEWVYR